MGIQVAEPVAVVEERWGPLCGRSWYISRYQGGEQLLDYLDADGWQERFQKIVKQITGFFRVMVDAGYSHGDMKATNLLVSEGLLYVLDLDASRQHRFSFTHRRALRRDRARFLKNWKNQPELSAAFSEQLDLAGMP